MNITITFPDGANRKYEKGITAMEIAKSISEGLARRIIAVKINGKLAETNRPIDEDATLELLTWDDKDGKVAFWHSSAHLLAQTLEYFFPKIKLTIGPAIDQGFYYDVDLGDESLSEKDIPKIEKKMLEFAREKAEFKRRNVPKAEAISFYKQQQNEYKLELIEALDDGDITFCDHSNFTDLCRGGHIVNTGLIKAIKVLNIAGAYWRGNENNKQLTRVYGISFPKQKMMEEYLLMLEEAKKRDHRKLGKELELFTFSARVGGGLPLWMPRGNVIREQLSDFMRKEQKERGYMMVSTPHIGKKDLYVTSGHWAKYGEDSFKPIGTPNDGEEYLLKPMNCPHHCEIYKSKAWSYKDLPVRLSEFGTVYRYEQSGELNGLTRVRGFTQDDAHLFCRPDQLKDEFKDVIDLTMRVLDVLGMPDFTAQISLRDPENKEKYIGSDENWEKAEQAIIEATEEKGLEAVTEIGEAAFYGPKLDFMIKDALGRSWQLGTIQVDYNLPERFELEYIGSDNQKHRPVMIHRAPFGSLERFIGVLIEHFAGNFPVWLAPEQVAILPISDKFLDYCIEVENVLKNREIRTFVDERSEKIGRKIRDAEVMKIPYMLIVGEKERDDETVSVRKHREGDLGIMKLSAFIDRISKEIKPNITNKI
jgi:threonyl-tRNA synthetase